MVRIDLSLPLIYTLIITAFYWGWIAFEIWLVARESGTEKNDSEDRGSRNNIILWWSIGIILGIFAIPNLFPKLTIPGNPPILFATGIFFISAGILLRSWSVRKLGKLFRSKIVIQENHKLITTGPYKYLRNPSYTGVILTLIGFGIGIGNWLSLICLFIIALISFVRRVSFENQALLRKFGNEYKDYQKKTWSLIPFIW
jgi:protein-S-isoprenylcysteine O-methyltransferase Ste14